MSKIKELRKQNNVLSNLLNAVDIKAEIIERIDQSELKVWSDWATENNNGYDCHSFYAADIPVLLLEAKALEIHSISVHFYVPYEDQLKPDANDAWQAPRWAEGLSRRAVEVLQREGLTNRAAVVAALNDWAPATWFAKQNCGHKVYDELRHWINISD